MCVCGPTVYGPVQCEVQQYAVPVKEWAWAWAWVGRDANLLYCSHPWGFHVTTRPISIACRLVFVPRAEVSTSPGHLLTLGEVPSAPSPPPSTSTLIALSSQLMSGRILRTLITSEAKFSTAAATTQCSTQRIGKQVWNK